MPVIADFPQPLEHLVLPVEWDGHDGVNRAADNHCQLAADNDLQAIQAWLMEYRDSPQTQRHYRKEAERLLLWALWERGKPLSSLTREDCMAYEDFLIDPQPRARWCGPKTARSGTAWRPFQGPISAASRRTALLVINSLFNYLVSAGYLASNPQALMRRRNSSSPARAACERYLERDQWQALLDTVANLPKDTERQRRHYERVRFLVALLYLLGPRVGEIARHTMGSFVEVRGRWWWRVTGKGQKESKVPVNQDMLTALRNYRCSLGLTPLPTPDESTPLVLSLNGSFGISDNMLYRIVKALVIQTAERLATTDRELAEKLRRASTHWFRHTSLTHQADAGIDLTLVQRNARHAKLETTALYLHAEDERWHSAMEQHRLSDTN